MNFEIAHFLKTTIEDLQFVDKIAGLVQAVEEKNPNSEDKMIRRTFPMSYDVTINENVAGANCSVGKERDLIPNTKYKSVIYFEDKGISSRPGGRPGSNQMQANLRLVGWFNRQLLVGNRYADISTYCAAAMTGRWIGKNPKNFGNIRRLTVSVAGIPAANASLFAQYNYDETIRQYLMPPFVCLGIDLACKFEVSDRCLKGLNYEGGSKC